MTDDSIRITDETKDRLEDIKQNYYEHTTLTYSEAVDVLVAEYDEETTRASGEDDRATVNRTSADGGENSAETEENEGLSAAEKAEKFRQ